MKKTIPINDSEGCSRTIVSGYWKMFTANLLRIRGGERDRMTGIMEIYDEEDTILHLPREKGL